jgi:hypothetical protein
LVSLPDVTQAADLGLTEHWNPPAAGVTAATVPYSGVE